MAEVQQGINRVSELSDNRQPAAVDAAALNLDKLVDCLRRALEAPVMQEPLANIDVSGVEQDGGDAVVALIDDLLVLRDGTEGSRPAYLAAELLRDVADATFDPTGFEGASRDDRDRVIGVFVQHARAMPMVAHGVSELPARHTCGKRDQSPPLELSI